MNEDLHVNRRWTVRADELAERFSRSSGPGGQGVNTADSRVELSLDLARCQSLPEDLRARVLDSLGARLIDGVLVVAASTHRSQLQNRRAARQRMAGLLAEASAPPPPPRRGSRPTASATRRRLESKRRRSEIKRGRMRPGE